MSETNLLLGSLSNDLLRVASLTQRGSLVGAEKFWQQSQRWITGLENKQLKAYVKKIIIHLREDSSKLSIQKAERLLMYSILLQNYTLHNR